MDYIRVKRDSAFTLIELLVVVIIISLLVTAATASYLVAQRKSRDSTRKAQVNNIANALEAYYSINKSFPGYQNTANTNNTNNSVSGCQNVDSNNYYYTYDPNAICVNQQNITYFDHAQYSPSPDWIPNLGSYLSPIPIELNYIGSDGTSSGTPQDPLTDSNTQTLVYRHLDSGYAVYTPLETNIYDQDPNTFNSSPHQIPQDQPNLSASLSSYLSVGNNRYIYMVRQ
jgi:prepilin-type N-terminal cleavage/methylation domain-containing protein